MKFWPLHIQTYGIFHTQTLLGGKNSIQLGDNPGFFHCIFLEGFSTNFQDSAGCFRFHVQGTPIRSLSHGFDTQQSPAGRNSDLTYWHPPARLPTADLESLLAPGRSLRQQTTSQWRGARLPCILHQTAHQLGLAPVVMFSVEWNVVLSFWTSICWDVSVDTRQWGVQKQIVPTRERGKWNEFNEIKEWCPKDKLLSGLCLARCPLTLLSCTKLVTTIWIVHLSHTLLHITWAFSQAMGSCGKPKCWKCIFEMQARGWKLLYNL